MDQTNEIDYQTAPKYFEVESIIERPTKNNAWETFIKKKKRHQTIIILRNILFLTISFIIGYFMGTIKCSIENYLNKDSENQLKTYTKIVTKRIKDFPIQTLIISNIGSNSFHSEMNYRKQHQKLKSIKV